MADQPIFLGRAHFSGATQGWSEGYWLNGNTNAAAKTAMKAIVDARMAMLPSGISCDYANVSQLGINRDSYLIVPVSEDGLLTADSMTVNRLQDALEIRQETAAGKFANRYVHGIPDPNVVNGVYYPGADTTTFHAKLLDYLTAVRTNSGLLKVDKAFDPPAKSVETIVLTFNRGITEHKVGRPFNQRPGRRRPA